MPAEESTESATDGTDSQIVTGGNSEKPDKTPENDSTARELEISGSGEKSMNNSVLNQENMNGVEHSIQNERIATDSENVNETADIAPHSMNLSNADPASYIHSDYIIAMSLQEEENRNMRPICKPQVDSMEEPIDCLEAEENSFRDCYNLYKKCQMLRPGVPVPRPMSLLNVSVLQFIRGYYKVLKGHVFAIPETPDSTVPESPDNIKSAERDDDDVFLPDDDFEEVKPMSAFNEFVLAAKGRIDRVSRHPLFPQVNGNSPADDGYSAPKRRRLIEDDDEEEESMRYLDPSEHPVDTIELDDITEDEALARAIYASGKFYEKENRSRAPEDDGFEAPDEDLLQEVTSQENTASPETAPSSSEDSSPMVDEETQSSIDKITYYLVQLDALKNASASESASNKPNIPWKDPENMEPLNDIPIAETIKMPREYVQKIAEAQVAAVKNKSLPVTNITPRPKKSFNFRKIMHEPEFLQIARSTDFSSVVVPELLMNTKFEVYIRFPLLERPEYVQSVLNHFGFSAYNGRLIKSMPQSIKDMTVAEFYKDAIYTWIGLHLDERTADEPLTEQDRQIHKERFYEYVKCRKNMLVRHVRNHQQKKLMKAQIDNVCNILRERSIIELDIIESRFYMDRHLRTPAPLLQENGFLINNNRRSNETQRTQNENFLSKSNGVAAQNEHQPVSRSDVQRVFGVGVCTNQSNKPCADAAGEALLEKTSKEQDVETPAEKMKDDKDGCDK